MKKLQASKEQDPEWIKVIAENVFNKDINKLSDGQRKILRDLFLNNLSLTIIHIKRETPVKVNKK